jgi:DMSO/TMAO reductase YedYZ molybdopterin-dependent catalytic subunit
MVKFVDGGKDKDHIRKDIIMKKRRQFIKMVLGVFVGMGFLLNPIAAGCRLVWAKAKKIILPKGTQMVHLIGKNPADLDTKNLDLTPLEAFQTMGQKDYHVNLRKWRLEIDGQVQLSLKLTYDQIVQMPSIEKNVLLICPGVFAYHAHWKGISVVKLLEMARMVTGVTHVVFRGPEGTYEKRMRFPIEDIHSDKVFLAYNVNGETLPVKHGFPLRVVAEDYYGGDWVKYVYKITAIES